MSVWNAGANDQPRIKKATASNLERLARGWGNRKTRFHDERGNHIDPASAAYSVPLAFTSAMLRLCFGYRPCVPWLSYRAIRQIEQLVRPHWNVVEFGSGMSTVWFARRCGYLVSIEGDEGWYNHVSRILDKQCLTNVRYILRSTADVYGDLSEYPSNHFDFALVDGAVRAACMRSVLTKIKTGGWIYLDNVDLDAMRPDSDCRQAEEALLCAVVERQGTVRYFVDFQPTSFVVTRGMLAQL